MRRKVDTPASRPVPLRIGKRKSPRLPPAPSRAALVRIPLAGAEELEGTLTIPPRARGIIIFAHGSGSSRHSPRNQFVAQRFQQETFATLLIDLLTRAEDSYFGNHFDVPLLTERLVAITDWVAQHPAMTQLPIGYFGASTGAAAAVRGAVLRPDLVRTVVARGGRVDLTKDVLAQLSVPILLIVGQRDGGVRQVNEQAFLLLQCPKKLAEVPKATHLFEEPGTLEQVADLAAAWFQGHLARRTEEHAPIQPNM